VKSLPFMLPSVGSHCHWFFINLPALQHWCDITPHAQDGYYGTDSLVLHQSASIATPTWYFTPCPRWLSLYWYY
jgi:hypothetical protein